MASNVWNSGKVSSGLKETAILVLLFIEHLPLSDSGLRTTQGRMPFFSLCNCSSPLSAWIGDDWMLTVCVAEMWTVLRLSLHIHGFYGLLKEHSHLTLIANCYLLN